MASYKNIPNHSKRIMRDCKRIKIIRLKGTYYDLKNFYYEVVIDIIRFVALQGYHGRFWHKNVLHGHFHFPGSLIVSYYRTCYNIYEFEFFIFRLHLESDVSVGGIVFLLFGLFVKVN